MKYKIRFGVIATGDISDRILVSNPLYGEPIGNYGSCPVTPEAAWYKKLEDKCSYYSRLEASIKEEGYRNPIFCNSIEEGTFGRYGTCRLWIAKKNSLPIPAIICDQVGRWDHLEELKTKKEVNAKFKDPPRTLIMTKDEFRFDNCKHVHLVDNTTTHEDIVEMIRGN